MTSSISKLAEEEVWIRRGIKARRTRDEGRVRALDRDARGTRGAACSHGDRAPADRGRDPSGKLVFEAERISKQFGGTPVVRAFSARIMRGDRVGLIGPNGAGKTTLLRLLLGEIGSG